MKCEQCGTENLESSSFCKSCGKNLKEEYQTLDLPKTKNINENNLKQFKEKNQTNNRESNLENNTKNSLSQNCQCGQKIEQNWKFCPNCKSPITYEIKNTNNDKAIIYIIIYIISIAARLFFQISGGFLVAIIAITIGKIKCPNNKILNALFGLTISFIIIFVILIMTLLQACSNCSG